MYSEPTFHKVVNKLLVFYDSRSVITMFTWDSHRSLFRATWMLHPIKNCHHYKFRYFYWHFQLEATVEILYRIINMKLHARFYDNHMQGQKELRVFGMVVWRVTRSFSTGCVLSIESTKLCAWKHTKPELASSSITSASKTPLNK